METKRSHEPKIAQPLNSQQGFKSQLGTVPPCPVRHKVEQIDDPNVTGKSGPKKV